MKKVLFQQKFKTKQNKPQKNIKKSKHSKHMSNMDLNPNSPNKKHYRDYLIKIQNNVKACYAWHLDMLIKKRENIKQPRERKKNNIK